MMGRDIGDMDALGNPSAFTCPTCRGALWELQDGGQLRYRCHVGHSFSVESLLADQSEAVEGALYSALLAVEEKANALRRMAKLFAGKFPEEQVSYEARASEQEKYAGVIRRLLVGHVPE